MMRWTSHNAEPEGRRGTVIRGALALLGTLLIMLLTGMTGIALGAVPAPATGGKSIASLKPPFTFKIHVMTPDGQPQAGVKIHCRHPRSGRGPKKPLVDMNVVSDAQGIAEFKLTTADLELDRYFWFNLADSRFSGDSGAGISPVDNEYDYTIKVAPAQQFQLRVADETGKPIAGAKIWMLTDHPEFPRYVEGLFSATANAKTTTSGFAKVRFVDQKANIVASAKGYAASFQRGVSLPKDKPHEIRLGRGTTIRGRIADAAGKPVAGANVTAKQKDFVMDYIDDFILKGKSNAQGEFELPGAQAAGYTIMAQVTDPKRALTINPAEVTVTAGAAPAPVTMQAREGTLLKGKYVTRHKLSMADRPIFVAVFSPTNMNWEIKTGKDGAFAVTLPPGTQGMIDIVGISGYTNTPKVPDTIKFLKTERRSLRFNNAEPGVYEGIEVSFTQDARVSGVVKDSTGQPVTGMELVSAPDGYIIKLDAKGGYSTGIPAGRQVTFEVRDPQNRTRAIYQTEPFQAAEGEMIEKNITIPAGSLPKPEDSNCAIIGRVVTADGKPVAGARVCLGNSGVLMNGRENAATWRDGTFRPAYLETNARGEFSFNALLKGKTDVWADHPAFGSGWLRDVETDAIDVKIVLRPQPAELTYHGKVVDVDGKPSAGAAAALYADQNAGFAQVARATSDADGRFELKARPPQNYDRNMVLLCVPQQGAVAWKIVPYCSGEDLELKLKPAARVKGRVTDGRDKPLAGAEVHFYNAKDPDYGSVFFTGKIRGATPAASTDAQGRFTLERIPVGCSFSTIAMHADYGREFAWNTPIMAGDNTVTNIKLPEGVSVAGTVRYAGTGKPAAAATVTLEVYGDEKPWTLTNEKGVFLLKGIEANNMPLNLAAQDSATTPTWAGKASADHNVQQGERITGLEIILRQTLQARQAAWRKERGTAGPGKSLVSILEMIPPRNGGRNYQITTLQCDSAGSVKRQSTVTTSAMENVLYPLLWDAVNRMFWLGDRSGRLVRTDKDGKVLGETRPKKDDPLPGNMAIDPKTGRAWTVTTKGTIYGADLRVFSKDGDLVTSYPIAGAGIAYSPKDDCFWIVGKKILKVSREGKILHGSAEQAAWYWNRVEISPWDGAVWAVEGRHPQVAGSKDQILILEPDGRRRQRIGLAENSRCNLAFDARNRVAWVASADGVLKLSPEGKTLACAPLDVATVAVEPDTGCVWAGGRWGVYRLDPEGRLVWSREEPPSQDRNYWPERMVHLIPDAE